MLCPHWAACPLRRVLGGRSSAWTVVTGEPPQYLVPTRQAALCGEEQGGTPSLPEFGQCGISLSAPLPP